jgi:tetratricopeptide (TPR) repeat protein/CHAT domain-containing protein
MLRAIGDRNRAVISWGLALTASLVVSTGAVLPSKVAAAETKPVVLPDSERKKLLEERNRLTREAEEFRTKGKYAEAISATEKLLAIERRVFGDICDDVAGSLERIAQYELAREDFVSARKSRLEALSIRTKLHGNRDWRVTDARLAIEDVETRSRLTAAQRQELAQAERAAPQVEALYAKGEFRPAIQLGVQTLDKFRHTLGEQHPSTTESLNDLAVLYQSMGDSAKAEPLFRQALETQKKVLGEQHPSIASSLNNLAVLYHQTGQYAKAEPLFRQSLDIRTKVFGEQNTNTAQILGNLAVLYEEMGDYAKAEPLLQQTIRIRKLTLGEKHPDTAQSLHSLAVLYKSIGNYAQAEALFRQAITIRKEVLGVVHPDTALSLDHLAALYWATGDYLKAEPLFRQALDIDRKVWGEKHPKTANNLNNMGLLYQSMGDHAKAASLFGQALEIQKSVLGEKHPETATTLQNLATLYLSTGDYARAEPLYQQALEIREKVLGHGHPQTAQTLDSLATLYQNQGDYAKAEPLLRQALDILRKASGGQNESTAMSLNNLAILYESMGEYVKAEPLLRQALESFRKNLGEQHKKTVSVLNNLAGLYREMGDYAKAEPLYRKALEGHQQLLDQALSGFAERQQLTLEASMDYYLDTYLSGTGPAHVSDATAYGYVLRNKGAVTARQSGIRLEHRRPELQRLFKDFQTVSTRLANLSLAAPDSKEPEARLKVVEELTEQRELIETKLAAQSEAFARRRSIAKLSPAEQLAKLVAALPIHTALVDVLEYTHSSPPRAKRGPFEYEQRMLAFVVRPDGEVHKVDLGPTAPIAKAVTAWRQTYGASGSSDTGQTLRTLIWEPLAPFLGGADTILLSPDGPLHQLPLAALPGSKPGLYLLDERNIVIAPVPRLLPELFASASMPPIEAPTNTPLLIGNVAFDSARETTRAELAQAESSSLRSRSRSPARTREGGIRFGPLPGTAEEVEAISTMYRRLGVGEPRLLLGSEATEEAFRLEAPRHRWVHVATHGFFAPETVRSALEPTAEAQHQSSAGRLFGSANEIRGYHPGLLSGIVFAGANADIRRPNGAPRALRAERDEGILTALEVSGLDLSGVELVVLSACETGLGKTAGGEGVLGLQRAFQLAGAKNVVASLWKVDDNATVALMRLFYHKLWIEKKTPAAALREAQLALLHHPEQIESLATTRGPSFDHTVKLVDHGKRSPTAKTSSPRLWASFVISGAPK